jgi:lipoprotein-anchoring transpeptidase ErfK/SrfK
MNSSNLSRRDFLKLSGLGLAGLFAPPLDFDSDDPFLSQQGRVTVRSIWMYDQPSTSATRTGLFQRDAVLSITNTAISDDTASHNRVWYQINGEGYVYSGNIQPVRTLLNTPVTEIPRRQELLTEVSVPYTDVHEAPDQESRVVYRIYYETTHWIKDIRIDSKNGQVWYRIRDDKWDKSYYARAVHLRIMDTQELEPISPDVPHREKRIVVRLNQQIVIAYEGDKSVFVAPVSTGAVLPIGTYTTPIGNFLTYYKRPSRRMAAGDIEASGYDLPGVPWVQYITGNGIAFHGTYWHNDFGRPRSHGCINLASNAAKWLYLWSSPHVPHKSEYSVSLGGGTKVEIVL